MCASCVRRLAESELLLASHKNLGRTRARGDLRSESGGESIRLGRERGGFLGEALGQLPHPSSLLFGSETLRARKEGE